MFLCVSTIQKQNTMPENLPEAWLRGPVEGVPPLLQPVAHALLQAAEEMAEAMKNFPDDLLWKRPAGVASPGFHLLHAAGVLDRLTTYADGKPLCEEQLDYLKAECSPQTFAAKELVEKLETQVRYTLEKLKATDEKRLTERRTVGRKALPSTVLGLLFHAAEHTMRHTGQLLVTVKTLKAAGGR